MRARKKDANHADAAGYLRSLGWSVLDLAKHGCSVDFAVGRPGYAALLELKSDPKISHRPSKELTEDEKRLRDQWDGPYFVAESGEEAYRMLEAAYQARLAKP